MPTAKGRSKNHPLENPPTLVGLIAGAITALAVWGLDSVTWPGEVEAALLALAVAVGGVVGKIAQRWTQRVYYSPPPQ